MEGEIARATKFIRFWKNSELTCIWNATNNKDPYKCNCNGEICKEIENPSLQTFKFSNIECFLYCKHCKRYFFILKNESQF